MELTRHRVVLRGDKAYSLDEYAGECPVQVLELGVAESYGTHVLDIDLQDGWSGLAVVGYFDNGKDCADALLDNGVMQVPPSASKNPGTHTITFTGSDSEGYRVSTKIPYRILPKGCTTGSTPPPDPDVFQQFVEQLIAALDDYFAGGNLNDVWTKLLGGKQGWATPTGGGGTGQNGATFTPSVSPEGEISWTNDKSLPNPPPVNIRGPIGPQGEPGKQGPKGAPGADGPPGKTPVKGVDYWTTADQRQIVEAAAQSAAKKIPTANAVTPGLVKAQPVAEQGANVKAGILPDGTLVVPVGDGGGAAAGINPTLLATLNGDGVSAELTADVELTDGLYAFGGGIPESTPDANKGQTLYVRVGDTGVFGRGIRLGAMPSNATTGNQNEVATIFIKNNAMYLCGTFSAAAAANRNLLFKPDGIPILKQKIALYSQTGKPVPVGAYAMLWRLG